MTLFRQALERLQRSVEGTLAVTLIGIDGIPIESINDGGISLEAVSAEFTNFLRSIQLSNNDIDTGDVQHVAVMTDRYIINLSVLTSEYLILMVMSPDGNHGRARFELKKAKFALRDELI